MRCPGCSRTVRGGPRYCPSCGYQLAGRAPNEQRRSVLSIALLVLGTFAALILTAVLSPEEESARGALVGALLWTITLSAAGLVALVPLGRDAPGESFPLATNDRGIALGLGVGASGFIVNVGIVWALNAMLSSEVQSAGSPNIAVLLLTVVLLPSVLEELLDRGVLWTAVRRITGVGGTIVSTALVFAFLHGLNGAGLLEVPHRFVLGCLLGWLRARTGSLVPGMIAHGTNNLLAVFFFEVG